MPITLKGNSFIHPSVQIPHPDLVNIYGENVFIGAGCLIGPFSEIQSDVMIGDDCRIQSHCFIPSGTILGKNVFFSHGAKICNDRYPLVNNVDWQLEPVEIGDNSSVGTNATVMCGVTIGKNCILGAHSLALEDIPDSEVWIGVPAKFLRKI